MTSTPVSDATLFFSNISTKNQNVTGSNQTGESFSQVMRKTKEPGVNTFSKENQMADVSKETTKVSEKDTDVKGKEVREEAVSRNEKASESDKTQETKEINETDDAVEEELSEKAEELMGEIAKELGVSVEEIEKVLEELGIVPAELFNKENLAQVVVILEGAEDVTQIVMDEDLFAKVNRLLGKMEEMLTEVSETTDVTVEELMKYISEEVSVDKVQTENSETNVFADEVLTEDGEMPEITKQDTDTKVTVEVETENTIKVHITEGSESTSGHTDNHTSQNDGDTNQQFFTNVTTNNNVQNAALNVENGINQYLTFEAREIMQQVLDYIKVSVKPDITSLQMQLHPEELGTLQIEVSNKNGVLTAQFRAEDSNVKAVIESQLIQLKENLNEQGLKVQAVEVTVASQQFDRNLDKNGREGNMENEQNAPKKQIRRINLNDLDMETELEDADDAIRIAADMMARNGNTIDFMA